MVENKKNRLNPKFDFVGPAKAEFTSGYSLDKQKKDIDQKINDNKKTKKTSSLMIIVSLMAIALACLCSYTIWMLKETNNNLSQSSQTQKSSILNPFILSGETFSLVLDNPPVETFVKSSAPGKMELLNGNASLITTYLNSTTKDGKDIISGVEINSAEYDNKLSQDGFVALILKNLGADYTMGTEKVFLSKGFFTNKIISKSNPSLSYYPVVSSNNYYIIKIKNDAKQDPARTETAKFVEEIINKIYLN